MSGTFEITEVSEAKRSKKSNKPYIRCKTKKGYDIAVFGKEHITLVQKQNTPFYITCECKPTKHEVFKATGVTFWVYQNYPIYFSQVRRKTKV